jgi:peptidoglycan/LPS O-acetylase OafA/YrhL
VTQAFTGTQLTEKKRMTSPRLASLDGWRAVAILMVLGNHSTFAAGFPNGLNNFWIWFFDGGLGVRFFFVISGFLITWLMILERDKNGSVNLREFYIRRCLRILPVYFAFLGVLAVLQLIGFLKQNWISWIGNLTFTKDFFVGDPFSGHLWSLSVEEQFYLVWPSIFILLVRTNKIQLATKVLVFAISIVPFFRLFGAAYPERFAPLFGIESPLLCFDSLAFGCACAILYARKREAIERHFKTQSVLVVAVALMLILFPHIVTRLEQIQIQNFTLNFVMIEFGNSLQALGFSILLLHSVVAPGWSFYRILNWAWVRQIGILSYSLYIWQQLFWRPPQNWQLNHIWWMGLWIIPLFVVAAISYYGLERPFLKLRNRYREVKLTG